MALALAVWSITLEGGEEKSVELPTHVQITNISFGEDLADKTGRTAVKLTYSVSHTSDDDDDDDEDEDEDASARFTTVLCILTPGKIEQSSVNLILDPQSRPSFRATGKNTVYLTGNYIDQSPENDQSPFGSEFGSMDSEGAFDLREVSSDVEMHPDDLADVDSDASRFEEVEEDSSKAQKRPRESETADAPLKSPKKNKKLKAEDGKPIAVETSAVKEDEKVEAKEQGGEKEKKKKKKEKKKVGDTSGEKPTPVKTTITNGIVVEDHVVGTGPMAKKGNTVRMRYVGKLTNGKEFDKNTSGKPFSFNLGKGEVIKGWDEGIVGMQVGGERRLTIPANMAYGKKAQSSIPANSTLIFEVKLIEIK